MRWIQTMSPENLSHVNERRTKPMLPNRPKPQRHFKPETESYDHCKGRMIAFKHVQRHGRSKMYSQLALKCIVSLL